MHQPQLWTDGPEAGGQPEAGSQEGIWGRIDRHDQNRLLELLAQVIGKAALDQEAPTDKEARHEPER